MLLLILLQEKILVVHEKELMGINDVLREMTYSTLTDAWVEESGSYVDCTSRVREKYSLIIPYHWCPPHAIIH